MKISSFWFWQSPKKLRDTVVVIDAYMMTTNLSLLLAKNPKSLLIVNEKNLKSAQKLYKDTVLIGESPIFPLSTFKATFPVEIANQDFKDKTLLFMTLNGSRVFERFYQKGRTMVGGSFNNLRTVVDFLKDKKEITVVKSGDKGKKLIDDQSCADIIELELAKKNYDWPAEKTKIINFIKSYYGHPERRDGSISYILDKDKYNILPICRRNQEGFLEIFDKIKED